MLYNPPTGSTDPNAPYLGKNVAAGTQGSKVPPKAIEATQREIVNTIVESGQSPTNDDFTQLLKAVRSGLTFTYSATGTPNALVINPITPHTQIPKGTQFRVFPLYANTDAGTLKVNQLTYSLLRRDGTPLQNGDLAGNVPFDVVSDGSAFRLMTAAFGEVQRLTQTATLWVRLDGNDANDGSGNDGAHAFATLAAALAAAQKISTTGSAILFRLGQPGTYASPGAINRPSGNYKILGDVANPSLYVISGAGQPSTPVITAAGCTLALSGLTVSNTGTVASTVGASTGGSVFLDNVILTSVGGNGNFHTAAFPGGNLTIGAGVVIASSMGGWLTVDGGNAVIGAVTVTFQGTPTWGGAGVYAIGNGRVGFVGTPTMAGGATGQRFNVSTNATITTNGAGDNFFPGSVAGARNNGGQYV